MARYPLWGTGHAGRSQHASRERRVNLYAEKNADRAGYVFYGTPGLSIFSSLGADPIRGAHVMNDLLYVVHRDTLYEVNNTGAATSKGTLDTISGRVDITDNGAELVVSDGTDGYTLTTGTFAKIADGDFPGAGSVASLDGYTIVAQPNSGDWNISALDDARNWDAADFANAESFSDNIVRVVTERGQVLLFGSQSLEFWSNAGTTDFPFARVQGAVVEFGLAAKWSVGRVGNALAFLAKNRTGEVEAIMLDGYSPTQIAPPEVTQAWNSYSSVADATAFGYRSAGHTFYQLNFPSAGKSWLFDVGTGLWSELESSGGRHRAEIGLDFLDKIIVSDYENGELYRVDPDVYTDAGETIAREIVGRYIFGDTPTVLRKLQVDIETGQGDEAQAMLSVSKDGRSWGPELWRSLGSVGEYGRRVIWRALGRSYEWSFRLRVSEPIRVCISGAWVDGQ